MLQNTALDSAPSAGRSADRLSAHAAAPYAQALSEHARRSPLHLMVPGHGCDTEHGFADLADWLGDAVAMDLPPMQEGIDLGVDSPLARAQALAADAWGATRTWFLTNGASQANRIAALAVRGLGEGVLMQRGAHSSFIDGVLLAGLDPTFVAPTVDRGHGIAHGVSPQTLEAALTRARHAGETPGAVYVVSPSYFGSVADVPGLARVAHAFGAALVVDGAWGAHFGFHPSLPESPVRQGADLVISSTHKLGAALTQAAMLHLGSGPHARALEPWVERSVGMTQSTSASALLQGSLDLARRGLVLGERAIGARIEAAGRLRAALRAEGFGIVSNGFDAFQDVVGTDPLRVPVDVSGTGWTGHEFRQRLAQDHDVHLEMSTATTVVAVIGALGVVDVERTCRAFRAVAGAAASGIAGPSEFPALPQAGPLVMRPREAWLAGAEVVDAGDAVGRISADTLAAYPPGIPNLLPGERITGENLDFLRAVAASPTGYVRGALDARVERVRVVSAAHA
jgi:arginine decarboxylase